MHIHKAQRRKAKVRLGLSAPSGFGKTYSALKLAFGLGGKVGMIDTESGSGELYSHLGDYDVITLDAPFTSQRYVEAIKTFEKAGYDTIIIDSLSHAWVGEGGSLDNQARITKRTGNSYTAWRDITPEYQALVTAMLQSPCHIIATMRAKTEYVVEANAKGKAVPIKVGMAPVMRDGIEYEFTIFLELAADHTALASKDRTGLLKDKIFICDETVGKQIAEWMESGSDQQPEDIEVVPAGLPADVVAAFEDRVNQCEDLEALRGIWSEFAEIAKEAKDVDAYGSLRDLVKARAADLTPADA